MQAAPLTACRTARYGGNLANRHDVPPDTVMGLIASIREKGWEIPENNKEENNMSRGQKILVSPVTSQQKILSGVLTSAGISGTIVFEIISFVLSFCKKAWNR